LLPIMVRSRRLAQALVECALVLPLVISLTLGVVQVMLYAHARDVMLGAVQEGARLAAEDGRGIDEGYARATALVRAGLGASVEPVRFQASVDGDSVVLRADTRLRPILPLPLVGDLPIHTEGHITRERFRPGGGR
jgi:Flp pilus assembly protein TadG